MQPSTRSVELIQELESMLPIHQRGWKTGIKPLFAAPPARCGSLMRPVARNT